VRVLDKTPLQRQRLGLGVPGTLGVDDKPGEVGVRLEVGVQGVVELVVRARLAPLEREHRPDPHGGQHEEGKHVRDGEPAQDERSALGEVHVDEEVRPRAVVAQIHAFAVSVKLFLGNDFKSDVHNV